MIADEETHICSGDQYHMALFLYAFSFSAISAAMAPIIRTELRKLEDSVSLTNIAFAKRFRRKRLYLMLDILPERGNNKNIANSKVTVLPYRSRLPA